MNSFFITGTDTQIGKTIVVQAILQSFQEANIPAMRLKLIKSNNVSSEIDHLSNHKSPIVRLDQLSNKWHRAEKNNQLILIEETFGWMTPLNSKDNYADWITAEKIPTILAVGIKEGCINHALLVAESITQRGIPFAGWVTNRIYPSIPYYSEIIKHKVTSTTFRRDSLSLSV